LSYEFSAFDANSSSIVTIRGVRLCRSEYFAAVSGVARQVDAMALRIVEPVVIAAADAAFLDPAELQGRAAMCAMPIEGADAPLLVAEDDHLFAEDFEFPRQVL
jgi:hypothetical protein